MPILRTALIALSHSRAPPGLDRARAGLATHGAPLRGRGDP